MDKIVDDAEKTAIKQQKRVVGRPFPPGVSGNPAGKPKGTKHFNTMFNELLKESINIKGMGKVTLLKAIATSMANKAIKGDVNAANFVADRTDGKPSQDVSVEVSTPPVPIYNGKSRRK